MRLRHLRTNGLWILSLLALLFLATAAPAKDRILLGMTIASTGTYSFASLQGYKGLQVWLDDVNQRGGIFVKAYGKKLPVELKTYDDRSNKETTVRLYEKLITEDHIDIAVAPFSSTLTTAAAVITEKHKVFHVIWAAASDRLYAEGHRYILSATQQPTALIPSAVVEMLQHTGVKRVALAYLDEPFPASQAEAYRRWFQDKGLQLVMFEKFPSGTMDYTPILQKLRGLRPDAFIDVAYIDAQANMLRQMKELDVNVPQVHMVYAALPQWIEMLGRDGLYVFGLTVWDARINWPVTHGLDNPTFIERFKAKFPDAEPDFESALAYGLGVVLEQIILEAGALDADSLKQAALRLSGKLVTVTGPYRVDEQGRQLGAPWVVTQVQEDPQTKALTKEIVWPKEVATREPIVPMPAWRER
ncbi:MAG: branched-chain amino acid ABC transporter substrate-binding protein [Candidatus Tectimicrobiota bacterium]|nr:MAG: branched-chain amino acid ABC transporter substrate-binding protein [Candidatus Tectomicrobia bacterium]